MSSTASDRDLASPDRISTPPKVSQLIAERVRSQIATGELRVGDRLPSEAEMIERYQVSRGSLREALRILETETLIEVTRGARSGPRVTAPKVSRLSEFASILLAAQGATVGDVHEARMHLEPSIVRALAAARNPRAIAALKACVADMQRGIDAGDRVTAAASLERFHAELVHASGNHTLDLLVGMLSGILGSNLAMTMIDSQEQNAAKLDLELKKIVHDYGRLTDLIEAGEADAAGAFWLSYMERSRDFLNESEMSRKRIRHAPGA